MDGCLNGLRVLVVDDEEDFRQSLLSIIALYGAAVVSSDSAADAHAKLEHGGFDLVVSDINMPHEDGCELIARLRDSPSVSLRDVPAAAMSACDDAAARRRALDAGFDTFVSKVSGVPSIIRSLAELVARGVGRAH